MVQINPQNMKDWMRMVERALVQTKSLPSTIATTVGQYRDEVLTRLTLRPTAPVELTYQTAFYIDPQGRRRSRLIVDFPAVTKATDGTDIQIARYELWGKDDTAGILAETTSSLPGEATPGITLPGLVETPGNIALDTEPKPWAIVASGVESFFRAENFLPGRWWRFRVRAIGVSTIEPGEWSAEIVVQMYEDHTPPPQPTAPTITSQRGVLTVSWDGLSVLGTMPADFKYAILAHGSESSPTHEVARFDRGGGFKVFSVPYYDPQFFRVRAIDESGNPGPWSEQAVGYTTPLVDTDVILSEIDAAETHLKNIDAGVSILPDTIISEHIVVTETLTGRMAQFLEVNAGMINANELWADAAFFGVADAVLVRSDMFEGKEFHGGRFVGANFETDIEEYLGIKWTSAGIKAYSPGGTETFSVDATTGKVHTVGRFSSGTGVSPFVTIIPAEDSYNGTQLAVLLARDGASLNGTGAGGMWIPDATTTSATRLNLRGMNGGGVNVQNGLLLSGSNTTMSAASELGLAAGDDLLISAGAGNTVKLLNNGAPYNVTSSSPANVYMHSTGQLFKSTSSIRYKTDVQPWDPGYQVLGIETYSWVDRHPTDPADPLKRYYGHIAEQVHEVMPELATLNDFGEPEAVQYERVGPALIPVIRDMVRRIEELESK